MSGGYLLDVNVLIAAAWPTHVSHEKVQQWLARHAREGWVTCPITESAFVRILSNPAFSPNALSPADALALLRSNTGHPSHRFWKDDIPFAEAVEAFGGKVVGHQQVTDSYLLGLATHNKGKLVTLDHAILSLFPEKSAGRERVVVI